MGFEYPGGCLTRHWAIIFCRFWFWWYLRLHHCFLHPLLEALSHFCNMSVFHMYWFMDTSIMNSSKNRTVAWLPQFLMSHHLWYVCYIHDIMNITFWLFSLHHWKVQHRFSAHRREMWKVLWNIMGFNTIMDWNLGPGDIQIVTSMGRVRGLVAVWEEARRKRDRIRFSTCPTLDHGRATTLALLSETVAQNATRRPGDRNLHSMGRKLAGITSNTNGLTPSMGRARARNPGPHPSVVDLCSKSHTCGLSAHVGAGMIYLPYPVHHVQSPHHPDLPVLSKTETQHLDLHHWRLLQDLSQDMRPWTWPLVQIMGLVSCAANFC